MLIKKAAGLASGATTPGRQLVGKVTLKDLRNIAEIKKDDLNSRDEAAAVKILAGTARSMGIEVVDEEK